MARPMGREATIPERVAVSATPTEVLKYRQAVAMVAIQPKTPATSAGAFFHRSIRKMNTRGKRAKSTAVMFIEHP
jgi:hypothetical protein